MANTANTLNSLNKLTKIKYASTITQLTYPDNYISNNVDFSTAERFGQQYVQPIQTGTEEGVGYFLGDTTTAMPPSVPAAYTQAMVNCGIIAISSQITYNTLTRMQTSQQAFEEGTRLTLGNLTDSLNRRAELNLMYGGTNLGVISSAAASTYFAAPAYDLTLTTGSIIDGLWSKATNIKFDVYSSAGVFKGTVSVLGANITPTAGIVTVSSNTSPTGIAANDTLYFNGTAGGTAEAVGLSVALTNSSTGSLWQVPLAGMDQWRAGLYDNQGTYMIKNRLDDYAAQLTSRGARGEYTVLVNNFIWSDLAKEFNSHMFVQTGKDFEFGSDAITYKSGLLKLKVVSYPYVKRGEIYIIDEKGMKRLGTTGTIKMGGPLGEDPWSKLPGTLAYEATGYTEQCIYVPRPALHAKIINVTRNPA